MSERDQFEAWFSDDGKYPHAVERSGEGYFFAAANSQWEAWQASREALKAEQEGDSDLLASAKKLEREVGDIVERLNQPAGDGFMCVPVADLYELQNKDGSAYCFSTSSSEAHGWVKEGYTIQEYVTLERLQDAVNQPEGDAWIACSERMPEVGEAVLIRISCCNHFNIENGKYKGDGLWLGCWFSTYGEKGSAYQVDHWMPLPSPPSQPHLIDTTSQQYETLAKGE